MPQVPKKSNKFVAKLASAAADDAVPRPAPQPIPATSQVTPSGPAVPEVSMVFTPTGQSMPKSNAGIACEHICPAHAHMLATGAIPKMPRDNFHQQHLCGPCSLTAIEDLLNGRNANGDPNESFIFIEASGSEDDELQGERAFVAAAAASSAMGMIGISPEFQVPPQPTVVQKKPPSVKPSVPEVSTFYDTNNNSKNKAKNEKILPPQIIRRKPLATVATVASRVPKITVDANLCPPHVCRPQVMMDVNKRSNMLDNIPSPPGSTLLQYNRSIQTTPDVCDKWTQVSMIASKGPAVNATSNAAIKGGSGGYLMPPSYKTKGNKKGARFVDPTINKKERHLTRDMVVQALNDLNNIFALPTYPEHDVVSIQFLSAPENLMGIVRRQPNKKVKGAKKNPSQTIPKVVPDLEDMEDLENPQNRSAVMRDLAMRYLPEWKQRLIFGDEDQDGKDTQNVGNVPINSGVRAAIVSDGAGTGDGTGASAGAGTGASAGAGTGAGTGAFTGTGTGAFTGASAGANASAGPSTASKSVGKAFEELVDRFVKPRPPGSNGPKDTMADKEPKAPVENTPMVRINNPKLDAKGKEGVADSGDQAYDFGDDDDEDIISDIPIALCRAEKELLMAFRERRVIMIMNRPNAK